LTARAVAVLREQLIVGQRQSGIAARDVYAYAVASSIGRLDRHRIADELGVGADVGEARRLLGYETRVDFAEGLRRTADYLIPERN